MTKLAKSNWINKKILNQKRNQIENNLYNWLVLSNNLTETIKKTGAQFSLTVLKQSFDTPYFDEINSFNDYLIDASYSMIRKVFLNADNIPIVFARVIIPEKTYLNYYDEFSKLGNAPIGNTILYANKQIERKDFEYKAVDDSDQIFQELIDFYKIKNKKRIWARRSIFILPKGPLLISELFLKVPDYPN